MPHHKRPENPPRTERASELEREFEQLGKETETDALLDALEESLRDWAPQDQREGEKESEDTIDRLSRQLTARSIFRELSDAGYHGEIPSTRPIESEVRKNLAELKKLIEQGKPPRRR